MIRTFSAVTAVFAAGMILSGCAKTSEPATPSSTAPPSSSQAATAPADLQSMVPSPAGATVSKGPDAIPDNGIHLYYEVKGAPAEVMASFKKALQEAGWDVTTAVTSSDAGGGGATLTGTNGPAYGIFDGGGPTATTYIDICTWAAKPANPNCARSGR